MAKITRFNWLSALQIGLIGGVVTVLMSLVGMVEEFGKRDIIAGVITMGQTLLFIAMLIAGYVAAGRTASKTGLIGLASGALAGLVTGGMLLAMQKRWKNSMRDCLNLKS